MANYKQDKLGRREKAYRDKLKKDALKNIAPVERKPIDEEDKKRLIELWKKQKEKN
jgi:hypothetical protein